MYQVIRDSGTKEQVLQQKKYCSPEGWEAEYLIFPELEKCDMIRHLFTTRLGGVSEGMFSSMNLSFDRGDDKANVLTNYRRIAQILGCQAEDMVASRQTHTTNIRLITGEDAGKGVTRERDYTDVDGLITNEKGIVLATFFADCVPLYFVDPLHQAIGLAHSGWRGTLGEMGRHMVEAMGEHFGSRPGDLIAAIGPSICRDCYEVDKDVADHFRTKFSDAVLPGKAEGKFQLDLWLINRMILEEAGIPRDNISVTDLCTCHNPEYLFSHRASHGKRGNLGAFLMLK